MMSNVINTLRKFNVIKSSIHHMISLVFGILLHML